MWAFSDVLEAAAETLLHDVSNPGEAPRVAHAHVLRDRLRSLRDGSARGDGLLCSAGEPHRDALRTQGVEIAVQWNTDWCM